MGAVAVKARAEHQVPPPCAPRKPWGAPRPGLTNSSARPQPHQRQGQGVAPKVTAPLGARFPGRARPGPAGAGTGGAAPARPPRTVAGAGPALSRELRRRRPSPWAAAAEPIKFVTKKKQEKGRKQTNKKNNKRCRRVCCGCCRVRECLPARGCRSRRGRTRCSSPRPGSAWPRQPSPSAGSCASAALRARS